MNAIQFLQQYFYLFLGGLLILMLFKTRILAKIYKIKYISAKEANRVLRSSLLLDIRTQRELENGAKIKGSRFIPFSELSKRIDELKQAGTDKRVIIVCRSGSRAPAAGIKLKRAGFTDVNVLQGGLIAWKRAGFFSSTKKKKKKKRK